MKINSQKDILAAWDQALAAVKANQNDLPHVVSQAGELEASLEDLRTLMCRKVTLRDEMMRNTQKLHDVLAHGGDLLARLRAGVRLRYGIHSDKVEEFGIKPIRKRSRVRK
jgi:hypothetical protein